MNILEKVGIHLRCAVCSGGYQVSLEQALLSHEMLHEGCPVSEERECPPLDWSRLLDERLMRDFEQSWNRLEEAARNAGGELVLLGKTEMRTGAAS